jgi:uncharacterized coiled-coil DUF342 family protein
MNVFAINGYLERGKEIDRLKSEKNGLINIIEDYKNAEVETNKTINKLRETIKSNKESFDWYDTPIPRDVLDVMRKRHNRNRKG